MDDPIHILIALAVLVFSVMIHESAHALTAYWLGDPTGKNLNRISLNPLNHIDPFYTVLVPVLCIMSGAPPIGAARPVPINPLNFLNVNRDMMLSGIAGPLSNLLSAGAATGLLFLLRLVAPKLVILGMYNVFFFYEMIIVNLVLGLFNMFPFPPMDGSRLLRYLLPRSGQSILDAMEPFGLPLILILLATGFLNFFVVPLGHFSHDLVIKIVTGSP